MTSAETIETLKSIAEILIGIGGLGGLIGVLVNRRSRALAVKEQEVKLAANLPAQTANTLVQGAGDLVDRYQTLLIQYQEKNEAQLQAIKTEQAEVKATLKRYGNRITYLMSGIQKLLEQLRDLDQPPCWQPDDCDLNERQ